MTFERLVPNAIEREAVRAVFRHLGLTRVVALDFNEATECTFFAPAEDLGGVDLRAASVSLATALPGRKVSLSPYPRPLPTVVVLPETESEAR